MEEGKESLNGHKVHQFREEERLLIGVPDPQDPDVILVGFSGFGLSMFFDNERLRTVPQIQEAAQNLVSHLARDLVKLIMEEKLRMERGQKPDEEA